MTQHTNAQALRPTVLDAGLDTTAVAAWRWERALAVLVIAAAAAAASATVSADVLAHRWWAAAQAANLIVAPVLIGLYWMRARPASRFGPLLLACGLVATIAVAQSAGHGRPLGVDGILFWATEVVILSFPTGRPDGPAATLIMPAATLAVALPALGLADGDGVVLIAVAAATIALLIARIVRGTPPRRRALAIGTPVALVFLLAQMGVLGFGLLEPAGGEPMVLLWLLAGSWSVVWYGFLFALIATQLFAGRVLRDVVAASMRQPAAGDLEGMLRRRLGDPGLRLAPDPGPGQAVTRIERDGRPAATIVHDPQLADDPELLATAGAVALLVRELADSRARLTEASDRERRKLERDLHDGAQQRLMGIQIKLRFARESVGTTALAEQLDAIGVDAERAVEELRALAHGIYPPVLRSFGLEAALRTVAMTAPIPVRVLDDGVGRCSRTIESAVYFCATEAVQNAIKHAGDGARVTITLGREPGRLEFAIADDGSGMAQASRDGEGLMGMRDRIGAVGGRLAITSPPGAGTTVRGTIPLDGGAAEAGR